ncbi:GMC oxidoreductase-domain-containing protein [Mycena epipterygia]|nr:GMC oxidoreductase-domain-containing protein [Mycena epipterygia]
MTASLEDVLGRGTFDFVVVGGGTCGLTLAARLTEDPNVSVLVLEAGPANLDDPNILTPAMFGVHFTNPQYDWSLTTVRQESAGGRNIYFARGKGLGGSSAINFFQYHRAARSDIDAFEKLGNTGWNWNLLKKYYMKSESFITPPVKTAEMSFDVAERGSDGPLAFGYPVILSNLEGPYQEALQKVGINRADDPFSGDTKGTWLTPVSIHPTQRVRSYAANMHYQPNASRANLTVLVSAHVTGLLLRDNAGVVTANGVRFMHGGKEHRVSVAREVVLAAGTIMSPQILELSGIGNPDILKKAGINVIVALPGVGENVQEHINSGATYGKPLSPDVLDGYSWFHLFGSLEIRKDKQETVKTFDCLNDPKVAAQQFTEYRLNGTGVCGMAPICMTFVPLAAVSPEATALQQSLEHSAPAFLL